MDSTLDLCSLYAIDTLVINIEDMMVVRIHTF